MWYEILPCLGIITAAVTVPSIFGYYAQKIFQNGNPYRRNLTIPFNLDLYKRDVRITGNTYKQQGLDAIPE